MNKSLELAAMALGGLSLFAVCFLGFAAMAGVPLHEVAVVGKVFPAPEEDGAEPDPTTAELSFPSPSPPQDEPGDDPAVSTRGVAGGWITESPFSHEELKDLADSLKLKKLELDQGLEELARREREAEAREASIAEQFASLESLRTSLEELGADLNLRAQEVARDESAAAERDDERWSNLARLFAEQPVEDAVKRIQAYPASEATRILLHLEDAVASEILNSITGDAFIEYAEAYAAAKSSTP